MQQVLIYDQSISTTETFELKEAGENTEIIGLVLGKGEDHFDIKIDTLHLARSTRCRTDFRIILKDKSACTLKGLIKIAKEAQQTDAFLNIKSLLLSDDASVITEPSLEIEANDVKASHSASSSQPDPEQLFYLQSRGLTEVQGKQMLVEGFLQELIGKIEDDRMRKDVELRLKQSFL